MCCSRRVAGRLSDARQDGASQIDEYGAHSTSLLLKPMDKNKIKYEKEETTYTKIYERIAGSPQKAGFLRRQVSRCRH